jgi:hypothetical protein
VEYQVKEMNENNLAMEEMPSSEDKPSPSQPMDGADYDTDSEHVCQVWFNLAQNYERKSKYENVDRRGMEAK